MNSMPPMADDVKPLVQRHLLAGWLGLLVFLSLGIGLEALHGLKLDYYLDLRNAPRRMLWTLAHTHGTLFSLMNLAFAWSITQLAHPPRLGWISIGFIVAQVLVPSGFFLGGVWLQGGDPNLGILLVPLGALILLAAVFGTLVVLWNDDRTIGKKGVKVGSRDQSKGTRRRGDQPR